MGMGETSENVVEKFKISRKVQVYRILFINMFGYIIFDSIIKIE
jgi:hypothetical protein